MKKTLILFIILFVLVGCDSTKIPESESKESKATSRQEIICVDGVKIWIGWKFAGDAGGLTSQIIGSCER